MAKDGTCQVCDQPCFWLEDDGALYLYGCCSAECLEKYFVSLAEMAEHLECDPQPWRDEAAKVAAMIEPTEEEDDARMEAEWTLADAAYEVTR